MWALDDEFVLMLDKVLSIPGHLLRPKSLSVKTGEPQTVTFPQEKCFATKALLLDAKELVSKVFKVHWRVVANCAVQPLVLPLQPTMAPIAVNLQGTNQAPALF